MAAVAAVPEPREARFALECLAQDDPDLLAVQVGADRVDGVRQAQACLRAALAQRVPLQEALGLARMRLAAILPVGDPLRRSAALTLLLARGVVRGHTRLGFDAAACDLASGPGEARPPRPPARGPRPQS